MRLCLERILDIQRVLSCFTDPVQQLEAVGDTSFPAACANGFWKDDSVIIKVPQFFKNNQAVGNGVYKVTLRRADSAISNAVNFTIQDEHQSRVFVL